MRRALQRAVILAFLEPFEDPAREPLHYLIGVFYQFGERPVKYFARSGHKILNAIAGLLESK